jgi:hypothetical protein
VPQLHRSSKDCLPAGTGEIRLSHLAAGGLCHKAFFALGENFIPCCAVHGKNTIEIAYLWRSKTGARPMSAGPVFGERQRIGFVTIALQ